MSNSNDIEQKDQLVVLIILNRLYEWSQNFITREFIVLKRQGVELWICVPNGSSKR